MLEYLPEDASATTLVVADGRTHYLREAAQGLRQAPDRLPRGAIFFRNDQP